MKLIHALAIIVATAVVLLLTLLPFLPGSYDTLALPLWTMTQLLGLVGLAIVPFAAMWLAAEWSTALHRWRSSFAIATVIVTALVAAFLTLTAAFASGRALAALVAIVFGLALTAAFRRVRRAPAGSSTRLAVYLLVLPVAAATLHVVVADAATNASRDRAIRNSEPLISDIEKYRAAFGSYPRSLLAVWKDYSPDVIGIDRYYYEPSGDAYNLVFEQPSFIFGTREFVVYNPRDEQIMTSHTAHLLTGPPEQLPRQRGFYAVHDAPQPHWKYFWFD